MNYTTKSQKLCAHILCANGAFLGGYCSDHQSERAEAAEASAAQLEAERDEQKQRADILEHACEKALNERDEARRELNALKHELSETFNSGDGVYRP